MAKIKVTSECPLYDGMSITFRAPCDCTAVDGLTVTYGETSATFAFRDAHGNDLTGIGNLFAAGAYVKAILDTTSGHAYLQNADTNTYIETSLAKMAVGTYVGTGVAGPGNPNSLPLGFDAHLVIVAHGSIAVNAPFSWSRCFIWVPSTSVTLIAGQDPEDQIQFKKEGNTLSWYSSYSNDDAIVAQLNEDGETYTYIAFGK